MTEPLVSGLDPRKRRRLIIGVLLRTAFTATLLVAIYYLLPLDRVERLSQWARLVVGLALIAAVTAWQIRTILKSRHPGLRAIEALAVTVPLFLLFFASTYFLMSGAGSGNFSQASLSRTDSLYFTVTTFATVGYGDITAITQGARLVVTVQMMLDLLILGLGVQAFLGAARLGHKRGAAASQTESASP